MLECETAKLGLRPLARIVDSCLVGSDPVLMLTGPIEATRLLLGRTGLAALAERNLRGAHALGARLGGLGRLRFAAPYFNEFVLEVPVDPEELNRALLRKGIVGGLPLRRMTAGAGAEADRRWLLCVTELNTREEIDRLVETVEGAL